jgi:hypothetical protein
MGKGGVDGEGADLVRRVETSSRDRKRDMVGAWLGRGWGAVLMLNNR